MSSQIREQGYALPPGWYLPDFWLSQVGTGCWFEVKGNAPSGRETALAQELADGSGFSAFIFAGQIEEASIETFSTGEPPILKQPRGLGFFPGVPHRAGCYVHERFGICRECGLIDIGGGDCYFPCIDDPLDGKKPDAFPSSSRKALLDRDPSKLTEHQRGILARHCRYRCMGDAEARRLKDAFDWARGVRFEFGENPGFDPKMIVETP